MRLMFRELYLSGLHTITGFFARMSALGHMLRGHKVTWRTETIPWIGYFGSIICEDCPDCSGQSLVFWGRNSQIVCWLGRKLCSTLGHDGKEHPNQWNETYDESGKMVCVPLESEWHCPRCFTRLD